MIFPERPLNAKDVERDVKTIKAPVLSYLSAELGLSVKDCQRIGLGIVIGPFAMSVADKAAWDFLMEVKKTGKCPKVEALKEDIVDLAAYRAWEEKFEAEEVLLARYGSKKVPREF